MSLSARTIASLIHKAQQQYEQACMVVARTDQAITAATQTKATLDQFLLERAAQGRLLSGGPTSAGALRISSSFSTKLRRAVSSQQAALDELLLSRQANLATLIATQRNLKTLESLQTTLRRVQLRSEQLAEQRDSDEFSALVVRTGSTLNQKPWNDS